MSFVSSVGKYFEGIGESLFGQLAPEIKTFLTNFVETDLGALAVAAVQEVNVSMPGAADDAKRAAAKAALISKAKAAGKDLLVFGESLLNFVVEAAVQVATAAATAGVAKI